MTKSLGDFLALLNPRRQAAGSDSMLLAISHPDLGLPIQAPREKQRGIIGAYIDSNRRTYWWPCPSWVPLQSSRGRLVPV